VARVEQLETRDRQRRRQEHRLRLLRRRSALASALGFVAFVGLAAQHVVGSTKRPAATSSTPQVVARVPYFDQQAAGFAFDDGSSTSAPPPPPVAQTNVS
jgi:hypothetical protein